MRGKSNPYDSADLVVKISTDGGLSWDSLWVEDEQEVFPQYISQGEYRIALLDLGDYVGQTVKIAFHYYGYRGDSFLLDFILINDSNVAAGRCCYGDPILPDCEVLSESNCTAITDFISWDQGLDCSANPCPNLDYDSDGIADSIDNCIFVYNPNQIDTDGDGYGDSCEANCGDIDNDGSVDIDDAILLYTYLIDSLPPGNVPFLSGADVDECGDINIADAEYIVSYLLHSGSAPCTGAAECIKPTGGNSISLGCPIGTTSDAEEKLQMPIFFTNDQAILGLSVGFELSSSDLIIDSVSFANFIYAGNPISVGSNIIRDPDCNKVLIAVLGDDPLPQQSDGKLADVWITKPADLPDLNVDIDSSFIMPYGEFIFCPENGGKINPQYIDCDTMDIIIGVDYICTDSDNDGYGDPGYPDNMCVDDNCPLIYNPSQLDYDQDNLGDSCDNCPYVYNPDQTDSDGDGYGDACETPCGDIDYNGSVTITDAVLLFDYLIDDVPPETYLYLSGADVDECGEINIGDIAYIFNYVFAMGPYPCEGSVNCIQPTGNNNISLGCPTGSSSSGEEHFQIPVYYTNDQAVSGISAGFGLNTTELRIDSVSFEGIAYSGSIMTGYNVITESDSNAVLIAIFGGGEPPDFGQLPQTGGLLASIWLTKPAGVTDLDVDIDSTFIEPIGEFIFALSDGGKIVPQYIDCGTNDIIIDPNYTCVDSDGDGYGDPNHPENICAEDNCPDIYNAIQQDQDSDGVGDVCDNCINVGNHLQEDQDVDNLGDSCDNCIDIYNPGQADTDNDQIGDQCDNCIDIPNSDQVDTDSDEVGDLCDNCVNVYNPLQIDTDLDGEGDLCDIDLDNDTVDNDNDNCPSAYNPGQEDSDEDGFGDACDKDSVQLIVVSGADSNGIIDSSFVVAVKIRSDYEINGGSLGF